LNVEGHREENSTRHLSFSIAHVMSRTKLASPQEKKIHLGWEVESQNLILESGFWNLDSGFWILESGF
jgi:hypothetical protein